MAKSSIPMLQRALARSLLTQASDAELLRLFAHDQNAEAFNELIQRHAALVWSVCRRSVRDGTIAEDAFQLTFVDLAKSVKSIRHPDRLAGWLYGVARRNANRLRLANQRPTVAEVPERPTPEQAPVEVVSQQEFMAAIDEEIARLPEKYRAAVLLCWFEDQSLEEVAGRLGITKDTLWGRLKQAREQLRKRLAARGYGLSLVFGAGLLFETRADANLIQRATVEAVRTPVQAARSWLPSWSLALSLLIASVGVGFGLMPRETPVPKMAEKKDEPKPEAVAVDDGFPLPPDALRRFGNRQMRHPDYVNDMVVSPDGKFLASAGNQAVVVWETKTLRAKHVFQVQAGYGSRSPRINFAPDSKRLLVTVHEESAMRDAPAGGGPGGRTRPLHEFAHVYDVETGKKLFGMTGDYLYQTASWYADGGKEILTFTATGNDYHMRISTAKDGKEIRTFRAPMIPNGVYFSGDGETIAYTDQAQVSPIVCEARTGKEIASLPGVKTQRLALSHDGKLLVYLSDKTITVYDVAAKKEKYSFAHPQGDNPETPLLISPDSKTLYFGSSNGFLLRWDLENNKEIKGLERHSFWTLNALAISPDGTLYSAGNDKVIRRWDTTTNKQHPLPDGYMTIVNMLPSVDGKSLFIADHGGLVHRWDMATGQRVQSYLKEPAGGVNCLTQSPDGKYLAVGGVLQDIRIWDVTSGVKVAEYTLIEKADRVGGDQVQQVAFTPDGKTLYSTSPKTGLTAWEPLTGKKKWNLPGTEMMLALDPLGRWLIKSDFYRHPIQPMTVLNAKTGETLAKLAIPEDDVVAKQQAAHAHYSPYPTSLAVNGDGSRVMVAHADGTLREWNTESWKEVRRLRTGRPGTTRIAFAPDGQWLAASLGKEVAVVDYHTGKVVRKLGAHDAEIQSLAFTRDGKQLLTNADLAPVLWNITPRDLPNAGFGVEELFNALSVDNIATTDAAKTYRLQWALIRDPEPLLKMARERIKPSAWAIDRKQFDTWLANLDSPRFAVREKATKDLTDADTKVPLDWLRNAHKAATSEEVRDRLHKLITEREKNPDRALIRLARIIQVLELANTPATRDLLKEWATTPGDTPPSVQAKVALQRLP